MIRRIGLILTVVTAAVLVSAGPASATVDPSSVAWSGDGTVLCLQAFGSLLGTPVDLTPDCNPIASGQEWHLTARGKLRAVGTNKYAVTTSVGTILGTWAQGTVYVYGPDHAITAGGQPLTHCATDGPSPYAGSQSDPACTTWYIFTKIG